LRFTRGRRRTHSSFLAKDPKALANRADELFALHSHDGLVAAMQDVSLEDVSLIAVGANNREQPTQPPAAARRRQGTRRSIQTGRGRHCLPIWSLATATSAGSTERRPVAAASPALRDPGAGGN